MMKPRLLRITTVPVSLKLLLEGQFTFFQDQGFEVLTASADGSEVEYLIKNKTRHEVVSMTRAITPLRDLFALWQLVRIILKFKPDIVHTHTPKAGLLGMMAAWICRVPVRMHTVAGLPLMEAVGIKRWLLVLTEKITYRCAHRVYPNSSGLLKYIQNEFQTKNTRPTGSFGRAKFKILGKGSSNGIDAVYFSRNAALEKQALAIREQYNISVDTIVFSFVGRIVKDKGIVELVHAFQKIEKSFPARLMLIGSCEENLDPLPVEIMTFIKNDNSVVLPGFQHDVRPWMMASDVFVFPSYREGFPNVVMQAACLEIPCIVSDINGCNEIIQQNETGLYVQTKDSESLYSAMLLMSNDKERRISFGQKAREFVAKNFDRAYFWNELLNEYHACLAVSGRKSSP